MLSKINNITVFFEQGEKLTIPADYIKKFYISNINKNGDEIPYEESGITNKLIANFVMILFNDNTLNQNEFNVLHMQFTNQINNPPQLILIEKKGDIINS